MNQLELEKLWLTKSDGAYINQLELEKFLADKI